MISEKVAQRVVISTFLLGLLSTVAGLILILASQFDARSTSLIIIGLLLVFIPPLSIKDLVVESSKLKVAIGAQNQPLVRLTSPDSNGGVDATNTEPRIRLLAPRDVEKVFATAAKRHPAIYDELIGAIGARAGISQVVDGKWYRFTTLSTGHHALYGATDPPHDAPVEDDVVWRGLFGLLAPDALSIELNLRTSQIEG